jgi:hypothetical protein
LEILWYRNVRDCGGQFVTEQEKESFGQYLSIIRSDELHLPVASTCGRSHASKERMCNHNAVLACHSVLNSGYPPRKVRQYLAPFRYSSRGDFRQQRIHNMNKEVLGADTPRGSTISRTTNPSIPQITINRSFFLPIV